MQPREPWQPWRGPATDGALAHVPPPPRTPTPRQLAIVDAFGRMRRWVGWFFLLHGGVMSAAFGWGVPGELALATSGEMVNGRVVSAVVDRSYKINRAYATKVVYRFDAGGETHEGSMHTVDRAFLARAQPGAVLRVEVVPWATFFSRPEGQSYSFFGLLGGLPLFEPLTAPFLLLSGYVARGRARRTFASGVPTLGRVVVRTAGRSRKNRVHSTRVVWQITVDGRTYQGELDAFEPELRTWSVGTELAVLHDPRNPSRNVPYLDETRPLPAPAAPQQAPAAPFQHM